MGKWVVWVFKNVGGKWEKQEDQSFSSDDQKAAESYFNKAKNQQGISVTSNLPSASAPNIVGSSWVGESDGCVYTFLENGYSLTAPNGSRLGTMPSKLRRVDNETIFTDSYVNREHTLTIKGDKMYGAPFGGGYLIRKK